MVDDLAQRIMSSKVPRRATKELIYESSLRLFASKGYAGTSLRDIAEVVGIEVASLYTHISGKNGLLFELMEHGSIDLLERLQAAVQEAPPDPTGRLFHLVRHHVLVNCERPQQTMVAFSEIRELSDSQKDVIIPLRRSIENLYVSCLDEGIESGEFLPVDSKVASYGIVSMGRGVMSWFRPDGPIQAEDIAVQYADQSVRGLLHPDRVTDYEERHLANAGD